MKTRIYIAGPMTLGELPNQLPAAGEFPDRERSEERFLRAGWNDHESAGFSQLGRDLRDEMLPLAIAKTAQYPISTQFISRGTSALRHLNDHGFCLT